MPPPAAPGLFGTLARAIIGQQISSKAAAAIDRRFRVLVSDPHEPTALLAAGEATLRSAGLSGIKSRYVLNLSEATASGRIPLMRCPSLGSVSSCPSPDDCSGRSLCGISGATSTRRPTRPQHR